MDMQTPHTSLTNRELILWSITFFLFVVADPITTAVAIESHPATHEMNPVSNAVIDSAGYVGLLIVKAIAATIALYYYTSLKIRYPDRRYRLWIMASFLTVGLITTTNNSIAILAISFM